MIRSVRVIKMQILFLQVNSISFRNSSYDKSLQSTKPVVKVINSSNSEQREKLELSEKKKKQQYIIAGAALLILLLAILNRKKISEFTSKIFRDRNSNSNSTSSTNGSPRKLGNNDFDGGNGPGGSDGPHRGHDRHRKHQDDGSGPPPHPPKMNEPDLISQVKEIEKPLEANSHLPQILIKKSQRVGVADEYKPLTQENIWALYDEQRFTDLLENEKELSAKISPYINFLKEQKLPLSLKTILNAADGNEVLKDFITSFEKKYNLDFSIPPKVYRFIGKSELDIIKSGNQVKNLRSGQRGIDVTTNPAFNWNDYRVTFKNRKDYSIHPADIEKTNVIRHEGDGNIDYYYLKSSYSIDDIEKIEKLTDDGFKEI